MKKDIGYCGICGNANSEAHSPGCANRLEPKLTLELSEHQARQFLKWLYAQPDYPRAAPPKRKALIVYTIADELEAQLGHFHGA